MELDSNPLHRPSPRTIGNGERETGAFRHRGRYEYRSRQTVQRFDVTLDTRPNRGLESGMCGVGLLGQPVCETELQLITSPR